VTNNSGSGLSGSGIINQEKTLADQFTDKKKKIKDDAAEKSGREDNESMGRDAGKKKKAIRLDSEKKKTGESLKELEAKLKAAEGEAKQAYDRLLRVSAEFENYKKRSCREIDEFRKFANESLLKEMLPVVDNLERAITSSGEDKSTNTCIVEGVDMTLKEILRIFEKFGVKAIEVLGKTFDPCFHQAVMQEETGKHPENTVSKELQKGYMIHDRLLRPAMVVVSSATTQKCEKK
jgi:molecular chaperone GrpE